MGAAVADGTDSRRCSGEGHSADQATVQKGERERQCVCFVAAAAAGREGVRHENKATAIV